MSRGDWVGSTEGFVLTVGALDGTEGVLLGAWLGKVTKTPMSSDPSQNCELSLISTATTRTVKMPGLSYMWV